LTWFLPALGLTAIAAFVDHPAVLALLLAAQPLFMAGAVSALGYLLEADFASLVLRRGTAYLVLLLAYAAFVALVVGTPAIRLAEAPDALNAVLLSAGIALAVAVLWRLWPAFGLVFIWDDAYPEEDSGSWIAAAITRSTSFARHLTAERDAFFGSGLPVAFGLLAVVAGAMCLAGLVGLLPSELRLSALWIWALVLCPLAHLLLAWRCERLLLDVDEGAEVATAVLEPALATEHLPLKPADPATRNAQVRAAAAANQVDLALALLAHGASADAMPATDDRDQRSLAIIAATCPDLRLLRELIRRGVDLNRAVAGLTPLLAATRDSYAGRADAVMTLITNGADPRTGDADGNTPLHFAALSREAAVAAILVDANAEPDAVNREGLTPLATACAAGNETLARFLLERGARPEPAGRALPALIAACGGSEDLPGLVKLLVKNRARTDARDRLGRSALHAAALLGHAEMLDALLAAGAELDARDQHGVTALIEAARSGANRVLQRLVFRKPAPDPVDQAGRNALVIACQSRNANEDTVRLLLALGVDPSQPAKDGRRAVEHAAAAGRWPLVALMDPEFPMPDAVQGGADDAPAATAPDRVALLRASLRHHRYGVASELLALQPAPTPAMLVPVAAALADEGGLEGLRWLLDGALAADARADEGAPLLFVLAARRPLPVAALRTVLDAGAACGGLGVADLIEGAADLDRARREGAAALALALIERGADVHVASARGRRALHAAAGLGCGRLVAALLERGADPNATDPRARTPLHELAALPDAEAMTLARALLSAGADPERPAADGQTALGAALAAGRAGLARWLSWSGAFRPPGRPLRGDDLPAAAALGDRVAVERLLDIGLPLDARDASGCTALLRACGGGHVELAAWLIGRGADPRCAAQTGATCLSAAVSARRDAIVRLLLDAGVPPDQPLPGGSTPLMVAAALGQPAVITELLARGATVGAADERGNQALHAAAQFTFGSNDGDRCRRLLELLLGAGAALDARNRAGLTPLLLLLGACAPAATPSPQRQLDALVGSLLARGADVGAQDERGVSCLHAVAMHGLADLTRVLLAAGADPALPDRLGRTAYDVALMLGYADVASELRLGRRSTARAG
jgi:ankyrin repeat protein